VVFILLFMLTLRLKAVRRLGAPDRMRDKTRRSEAVNEGSARRDRSARRCTPLWQRVCFKERISERADNDDRT
jgi:hypothetical protein